jgi:hypothetical protein
MASIRRQIEDRVIAALQPLLTSRILRAVRTFSGNLSADLDDVKRMTGGQLPAVLITTSRADYHAIQTQRRRHSKNVQLQLLVISPSLRSREEARRDDVGGGSAGIYLLMEYLCEALQGLDPTLPGVGRIEPASEEEFAVQPDVAVWRMTFTVPVDVNRPIDQTLADLLEIYSDVKLPAIEDPGKTVVATAWMVVGES